MSLEPGGDDWWQSNDGKWYPPSMPRLPAQDGPGGVPSHEPLQPRDPQIAAPGPRPAPGWAQHPPPPAAAAPTPIVGAGLPRAEDYVIRREVIITGTSKLALAAIILGVAGFLCTGVASIIAIVLGHSALIAIRRSGGYLGGRGLAWGGLALGYLQLISIGVLACAVFTAVDVGEQCTAAYDELEYAAEAYRAAYGAYPASEEQLVPDWIDEPSGLWDLQTTGTSLTIVSEGSC